MPHSWNCLWPCPRSRCWVLTKRTLRIVGKVGKYGSLGGTSPLILKLIHESPCHLKGWVLGSLLGCGKLKTEISDLVCFIPRSPRQTTLLRLLSQPRLSSLLMAWHHLLFRSGPASGALAHLRASGEDMGPREESRKPNSTCNKRGWVPNRKSYDGANSKGANSLLKNWQNC